jgi:hypothetical protein
LLVSNFMNQINGNGNKLQALLIYVGKQGECTKEFAFRKAPHCI